MVLEVKTGKMQVRENAANPSYHTANALRHIFSPCSSIYFPVSGLLSQALES